MIKLDDKTIDFINKILSMEKDFKLLLDDLCKDHKILSRRGAVVATMPQYITYYGIDKKDCDKLRKELNETLDSYKKIKQVYG